MPQELPNTSSGWYAFSQFGNSIYDQLLYYFSGDFAEIRAIVNKYDSDGLGNDATFGKFRQRLLNVDWTPRKVDAFLAHWFTYTADDPAKDESGMPLDEALKDRTVDCEEYETVANALLTRSGGCGDAVELYYLPEDPKADGEGHATKIVGWNPVTTVCNWGLINHYQDGTKDMSWIKDFISKANFFVKYSGSWNGEEFVQERGEEGAVYTEAPALLFKSVRANISEHMPTPKKFELGGLEKVDAEYMQDFIERRNSLIRTLDTYGQGTAEYGNAVRQLKFRNRVLKLPSYTLEQVKTKP